MRRVWVRGPRGFLTGIDNKGRSVVRLGKNGGPVIQQRVDLILVPKKATTK
jgi:hypothetical protein